MRERTIYPKEELRDRSLAFHQQRSGGTLNKKAWRRRLNHIKCASLPQRGSTVGWRQTLSSTLAISSCFYFWSKFFISSYLVFQFWIPWLLWKVHHGIFHAVCLVSSDFRPRSIRLGRHRLDNQPMAALGRFCPEINHCFSLGPVGGGPYAGVSAWGMSTFFATLSFTPPQCCIVTSYVDVWHWEVHPWRRDAHARRWHCAHLSPQ